MALVGPDHWLDQLDIPQIPHFSDPNFNPYGYDGADAWFSGRRETEVGVTISSLQMTVTKTEATLVDNDSVTDVVQQAEVALTEPLTEESSLDDHSSVGVSNAIARATKTATNPIHKSSPARPKRKLLQPLHSKITKAPAAYPLLAKPAVAHTVAVPLHKPGSPVVNAKMSDRATKQNVPPGLGTRSHTAGVRRDEPDKTGGHRRSVVAARAGEYFMRSLREYPEEGKTNASWK